MTVLQETSVPGWFDGSTLPELGWDGEEGVIVCLACFGHYLFLTNTPVYEIAFGEIQAARLHARLGPWALFPTLGSVLIIPQLEGSVFRYHVRKLICRPSQPVA